MKVQNLTESSNGVKQYSFNSELIALASSSRDLQGLPDSVSDIIITNDDVFDSLEGFPLEVGGLIIESCQKLTSLKGIRGKIGSVSDSTGVFLGSLHNLKTLKGIENCEVAVLILRNMSALLNLDYYPKGLTQLIIKGYLDTMIEDFGKIPSSVEQFNFTTKNNIDFDKFPASGLHLNTSTNNDSPLFLSANHIDFRHISKFIKNMKGIAKLKFETCSNLHYLFDIEGGFRLGGNTELAFTVNKGLSQKLDLFSGQAFLFDEGLGDFV